MTLYRGEPARGKFARLDFTNLAHHDCCKKMNNRPPTEKSILEAVEQARSDLRIYGPARVSPQVTGLLRAAPDNGAVNALAASWQTRLNQLDAAKPLLEKALELTPTDPETLRAASDYYRHKNDYKKALTFMKQAVKAAPRDVRLYLLMGELLRETGLNEEALRFYNQAIKLEPHNPNSYYYKSNLPGITLSRKELKIVEKLLGIEQLDAHFKSLLNFALARHYLSCGDIESEMHALERANNFKCNELNYDIRSEAFSSPKRVRQAFSRERVTSMQLDTDGGDPLIFILGFPRSGSTLLEQMLCTLPDISSAGETSALQIAEVNTLGATLQSTPYPDWFQDTSQPVLKRLRQMYRELQKHHHNRSFLIDKSLENIYRVGLIKVLFPGAKILHTFKHPVDCCLGCYRQMFQGGAWPCIYDKKQLADSYRHYHEIMTYWDTLFDGEIYHVAYEQLVSDPAATSRAITDYCGLEWRAEMTQLENSRAAVRTQSASQVREQLHTREIGRWKKYEPWLGELLELQNLPAFQNPSAH